VHPPPHQQHATPTSPAPAKPRLPAHTRPENGRAAFCLVIPQVIDVLSCARKSTSFASPAPKGDTSGRRVAGIDARAKRGEGPGGYARPCLPKAPYACAWNIIPLPLALHTRKAQEKFAIRVPPPCPPPSGGVTHGLLHGRPGPSGRLVTSVGRLLSPQHGIGWVCFTR
jgi:hypothetical protein